MTITNFTAHESDGEHATGFDDETRDGAASAHQAETETGRSSTSARPGGYGPGGYGPGGYGPGGYGPGGYGAEVAALMRPVQGRMLGGVAAGVADYFGFDVLVVRLLFVIATLAGGIGFPAYIAAWMLVPDEGTGISIASDLLGHVRTQEVR